MATWADVDRLALALPEVTAGVSRGNRDWSVRTRTFAWQRPLRPADRLALGGDTPDGPVLAAHVDTLESKDALLAESGVYFTTPHFRGYCAILVRLDLIGTDELAELMTEAWLARAPKRLAAAFLARRGDS